MIQNSLLNSIIEKAIKALRDKRERMDKKGIKEPARCNIEEIFANSTESEKQTIRKYNNSNFKKSLAANLQNHQKIRFDEHRGLFYFNKRWGMVDQRQGSFFSDLYTKTRF